MPAGYDNRCEYNTLRCILKTEAGPTYLKMVYQVSIVARRQGAWLESRVVSEVASVGGMIDEICKGHSSLQCDLQAQSSIRSRHVLTCIDGYHPVVLY